MRGPSQYYYTRLPAPLAVLVPRGVTHWTYAPIGQALPTPAPAPQTPEEERALADRIASGVSDAFRKITLSVVLMAVVTGAAFATGNWLAHAYILPKKNT